MELGARFISYRELATEANSSVRLTAKPAEGYRFKYFRDYDDPDFDFSDPIYANPATIDYIHSNRRYEAVFEVDPDSFSPQSFERSSMLGMVRKPWNYPTVLYIPNSYDDRDPYTFVWANKEKTRFTEIDLLTIDKDFLGGIDAIESVAVYRYSDLQARKPMHTFYFDLPDWKEDSHENSGILRPSNWMETKYSFSLYYRKIGFNSYAEDRVWPKTHLFPTLGIGADISQVDTDRDFTMDIRNADHGADRLREILMDKGYLPNAPLREDSIFDDGYVEEEQGPAPLDNFLYFVVNLKNGTKKKWKRLLYDNEIPTINMAFVDWKFKDFYITR